MRWEKGAGGQSRVRVSPELVQVATASTRWQQPFDAALTDVFQVQADVASRVAQAMDVALGAGEKEALAGKPTANLPAYDLYLQGNEAADGFDAVAPAELRRAIGYYERAVALDSTFALAWAQLSRAHSYIYQISLPTAAGRRAGASAAVERALALSPGLAEGAPRAGGLLEPGPRTTPRPRSRNTRRGRELAPNNADLLQGRSASSARSQGHWDRSQEALHPGARRSTRARSGPRGGSPTTCSGSDRYPEAIDVGRPGAGARPARTRCLRDEGHGVPGPGRSGRGARRRRRRQQREVEPTALVQWIATYYDLFWVLDDEQQKLLLRLPPGPFDDDRKSGAWRSREPTRYAGDAARARAYADSARIAGEAYLRDAPDDAQLHALLGTALAYAGRKAEAIREGRRAVELAPTEPGRLPGALYAAPARADLSAGRRAGAGARRARAAAQDPVLPRLRAGSRSTPRSTRCGEPAVPEAGPRGVGRAVGSARGGRAEPPQKNAVAVRPAPRAAPGAPGRAALRLEQRRGAAGGGAVAPQGASVRSSDLGDPSRAQALQRPGGAAAPTPAAGRMPTSS